jgi:hypothetical protein
MFPATSRPSHREGTSPQRDAFCQLDFGPTHGSGSERVIVLARLMDFCLHGFLIEYVLLAVTRQFHNDLSTLSVADNAQINELARLGFARHLSKVRNVTRPLHVCGELLIL